MSDELTNPLLQQTQDKIENQLTPENQQNYTKIVVAGMHAGLLGGPKSILASLKQSQDPVADAAKGAVSLVLILRRHAKGVMPGRAMVPAAMTLMLKALDFIDRAKIVRIGQPELVRATHLFSDEMFKAFGITKQGIVHAGQRVYAMTQDPEKMAAIRLKAGVTRHPMAATPTLPGVV